MAVGTNLLMGAAMAVVLLGTGAMLTRSRHWRGYSPSVPVGGYGGAADEPDFARIAKTRTAWTAAYLAALVLVVSGGWLYLDGSAATQATLTLVLGGVGALGLTILVFAGIYQVARAHGYHSAAAVMVASFLFATLLLVGLAAKLIVASG